MTREEYVPNERFVDHANTGGVWTFTFEPDETGTTLSVAFRLVEQGSVRGRAGGPQLGGRQ